MQLRVLVVEDDLLIALSLEEMLERAGHLVVGAAIDMAGALAAADGSNADLAVMDVDLARGANGLQTARLLRQRHDIPSLFVSAKIDDELRAMASEWRPVGFISKPFEERQFLNALKTVCGSA